MRNTWHGRPDLPNHKEKRSQHPYRCVGNCPRPPLVKASRVPHTARVKEYLFNAEKRHKLKLPLLPSAEGLNSAHPAQKQLDQILGKLLDSASRPFWRVELRKVLTPEGMVCSCMTLDAFDRPIYLLVDDPYARIHLQTPLVKGLKADQVASAMVFLRANDYELAFKAVPQWTLAAHVEYPFDMFVTQADILLRGFRNEARETANLVREHLATERWQQGYMGWAA